MSRETRHILAAAGLLGIVLVASWLSLEQAPAETGPPLRGARSADEPGPLDLGVTEAAAPVALRVVAVIGPDAPRDALPPAQVVDSDFAKTSTVRGCVRWQGRPALGASVDVRQEGGAGLQLLRAWPTIHCDAGGCFEAVFDANATVSLRASLGTAASEWVSVETSGASEHEVVLALIEPYVIRGRVSYADGELAPLSIVTARCGNDEVDSFGVLVTSAGTGEDGRFEIPIERPGTYVVEAMHLPDFVASQRDVTVNDAQPEVAVVLTLAPRAP